MEVEVVGTGEFEQWFDELDAEMTRDVTKAVNLLEQIGLDLGFPKSSKVHGARFPLRELRLWSKGHPIRVFYAFDVKRQAVLLIGGDKSGDDRFYDYMVPRAERIWKEYCNEIASMG